MTTLEKAERIVGGHLRRAENVERGIALKPSNVTSKAMLSLATPTLKRASSPWATGMR